MNIQLRHSDHQITAEMLLNDNHINFKMFSNDYHDYYIKIKMLYYDPQINMTMLQSECQINIKILHDADDLSLDLQRQLAASKEKNAELLDDRSKLVSLCFPQQQAILICG